MGSLGSPANSMDISAQSTPTPTPIGRALTRSEMSRKVGGSIEEAAQVAIDEREEQRGRREEMRRMMDLLSDHCPGCFVMTGQLVRKHVLGPGCRKALEVREYLDVGMGWIDFKKAIRYGEKDMKFCFGCLMPISKGHEIVDHNDGMIGSVCKYNDIAAQVVWVIFKCPDLYKEMADEFLEGMMMQKNELAMWCKKKESIYYTNTLMVFYWICNKLELLPRS